MKSDLQIMNPILFTAAVVAVAAVALNDETSLSVLLADCRCRRTTGTVYLLCKT